MQIIRKYEIDPQKFNRVRFEMQREDKERNEELASNVFKNIYKRLGIKTNLNDEKILYQYYQQGATRDYSMNLRQLDRLIEVLAKQYYK